MNIAACQQAVEGVGSGVAASLRAVDCAAGATAQAAFGRLFANDGALVVALTILLTLYIAFFGFSLMVGRSRLGISALTSRMITLGFVLTFATSWIAYQSLVWNLTVGAPDELASILTGVDGSATDAFAQKLDVVFAALVDASSQPGVEQETAATFSPPGLMWLGGTLLLLGTVGILATCKIALAILLALGPVFVVLALFPATRGLFAGWLKGVIMLALTPIFAVLGGSLMLELSVPVLRSLVQNPGSIDPQAAMAFFMIGAVHCALMVLVLKVAGTMVAGWRVFGLSGRLEVDRDDRLPGSMPAQPAAAAAAPASAEQSRTPALAPSREIRLARAPMIAANDTAPAATGPSRERAVGAAAGGFEGSANASFSRARGIGSRFRAPLRPMEKLK